MNKYIHSYFINIYTLYIYIYEKLDNEFSIWRCEKYGRFCQKVGPHPMMYRDSQILSNFLLSFPGLLVSNLHFNVVHTLIQL